MCQTATTETLPQCCLVLGSLSLKSVKAAFNQRHFVVRLFYCTSTLLVRVLGATVKRISSRRRKPATEHEASIKTVGKWRQLSRLQNEKSESDPWLKTFFADVITVILTLNPWRNVTRITYRLKRTTGTLNVRPWTRAMTSDKQISGILTYFITNFNRFYVREKNVYFNVFYNGHERAEQPC